MGQGGKEGNIPGKNVALSYGPSQSPFLGYQACQPRCKVHISHFPMPVFCGLKQRLYAYLLTSDTFSDEVFSPSACYQNPQNGRADGFI